jgi:hypothetical protein
MRRSLLPLVLRTVPIDAVMRQLGQVSAFDRYQASLGLEQAADVVAQAAEAAGLSQVEVQRFHADGAAQWWSFRAPVSWTPIRAGFEVLDRAGRTTLSLDHAEAPFVVATYSAATPPGGALGRLERVRRVDHIAALRPGAIAVLDRSVFAQGSVLGDLAAAGALGFVTDAPGKGTPGDVATGRIELSPQSELLAFSLTPGQFSVVADAADQGARVRVDVEVDRTAAMPVVSGVLPGAQDADEVWLIAHLCHPRPGANDNASGVAALLGVAATLAALRRRDAAFGTRRGIRFFWGPEFLGSAAVLHQRMVLGRGGLPSALINLDMVGEDQELCRSPFVVERPPETTPSLLGPLAEHVVDEVFQATSRHPGRWSPSPFLGFSDHALFADPSVARPAVQFCHPDDRFNHSAADSLDKVSPVEMLRATAAGAVLAQILADDGSQREDLRELVDRWCLREEISAAQVAGEADAAWGEGLVQHVQRLNAAMRALAAGAPLPEAPGAAGSAAKGPLLRRRWDGPLNLRSMLGELSAPTRVRINTLISSDKLCLSVLFNLAIRADASRDADQIITETSFALRRPLDPAVTLELLAALTESGYIQG